MTNLFDKTYDESYLEEEPCTLHGESSCAQCMEGDFRYPTFQEGADCGSWRMGGDNG